MDRLEERNEEVASLPIDPIIYTLSLDFRLLRRSKNKLIKSDPSSVFALARRPKTRRHIIGNPRKLFAVTDLWTRSFPWSWWAPTPALIPRSHRQTHILVNLIGNKYLWSDATTKTSDSRDSWAAANGSARPSSTLA